MLEMFNGIRKKRIFVVFAIAFALFCDFLSFSITIPLFPTLLKKINPSLTSHQVELLSGVLFSSYAAGVFCGSIVFSYVSDKYKLRKSLLISSVVLMDCAVLMFALGTSIELLIISRVILGISSAITWVVGLAIVADISNMQQVGSSMGLIVSGSSMGYFLGPPISGVLADLTGGVAVAMIISSVVSLIDLALRCLIHIPQQESVVENASAILTDIQSKEESGNSINDMKENKKSRVSSNIEKTIFSSRNSSPKKNVTFGDIIYSQEMVATLTAVFVYSVIVHSFESILTSQLSFEYNTTLTQTSLAFFAMGLPTIVGSYCGGKLSDLYSKKLVSSCAFLAWSLCNFCLGLKMSFAVFCGILSIFGFTESLVLTPLLSDMHNIVRKKTRSFFIHSVSKMHIEGQILDNNSTMVSDLSGSRFYARIYALYNIVSSCGMVLGPLYSGLVFQFGFSMMLIFPIVLGVLIVPVLVYSRHITIDQ